LLLENEYPVKLSSFGFHTSVLTNLNRAFSFGDNSEGQLGSPVTNTRRPLLISTINFEANEYFIDVQAGHRFAVGLTNLGKIYAWGNNFNTYLASNFTPFDKSSQAQVIPYRIISNSTGARFSKIAVGYSHFMALTETNLVVGFGYNETYRLGDGTRVDRPGGTITQLPNLLPNEIPVEVYASSSNSYVLTNLGRLYSMGSTIGYGNGVTTIQLTPGLVSLENLASGDSISKVFTGHSTTYILTKSNKVYAWGSNANYQVGNNSNVNVLIPIEITGFSLNQNEKIINLYGGSNHVFATTNFFRVFGWGGNAEYQLGNGTNVDVRTPQLIEF
jgi:alpha-tubulin suppressor-like RCC1 family protein